MTIEQINLLQYEASKKVKLKFPYKYGQRLFALLSMVEQKETIPEKMVFGISKEIASKLANKLTNGKEEIKLSLKYFEALALYEVIKPVHEVNDLYQVLQSEILTEIDRKLIA